MRKLLRKNEEQLTDDQVFQLTKLVFTEIKGNFQANYVGDNDRLQKFMIEYIEPLYPSKRNLRIQNQDQIVTEQSSKNQQPQHANKKISNQNIENENASKPSSQQNIKINTQVSKIQQKRCEQQSSQEQPTVGIQKYSFKQLCLYLGIGNFICCKSYPPDPVYEDLGLGICLYLKFMKHLVYTLLILSILPIMQIVFFYSIAVSNNYDPASNYQRTLFAFTIGTLSLEGIRCSHKALDLTQTYSLDLTCPVGEVRVLGPVFSMSKLSNLRACKEDINLWISKSKYFIDDLNYIASTNCNTPQANCTYNITVTSQPSQFNDISITYECINGKSKFGGIQLSRSTALICSVIFDLIFIIGMVIFFISETLAQNKQKSWFKAKQLMLDQFTLEAGYFNTNNFIQQFNHFLTQLKKAMVSNNQLTDNNKNSKIQKDLHQNIVQIRIPDNQKFLQIQQKRKQCYDNFYELLGEKFIKKDRDPAMYISTEDFIENAFKNEKKYLKFKKSFQKVLRQYVKVQRQVDLQSQQRVKVYIVFSRPKYKRYALQNTVFSQGRRYLQPQKYQHFQSEQQQKVDNNNNGRNQNNDNQTQSQGQQKRYFIQKPPAPAVILWENKGKGKKVLRNIISWTITILLVGATYVLIAFILWQQNKLLQNYNFNIECNTLYPDNPFSQFQLQLFTINQQTYTHCYCTAKSIFLFINNEPQCQDWSFQFSLFIMIPIVFSVGIVVINAVISIIYRALSKFEAHDYLTSQLYSYIVKKSLLLILNLALIIIVLSIDTKSTLSNKQALSFLFQGIYSDITADWYLEVGLIITLTMIFNLLSPFIDTILFLVLEIVKKITLKMFHKRPKHQKIRSSLLKFYNEEYFPIEQRYALILALLTITMCLNYVFPLLTIILLLNLFFLQINDKVLIIKAYQKPINFNDQLHSKFMKSLLVILILHLVVTALLITEPFLLVAGQPNLQGSIRDVNLNRFNAFFQTGYIVPYALLFVIILVSVCVNFASGLYLKTKPNERVSLGLDGVPYEQQKFYHLLNKYELGRTLALKKKQLQTLQYLDEYYSGKKLKNKRQNNKQQQSDKNEDEHPPQIDSSTNIRPNKQRDNSINDNKDLKMSCQENGKSILKSIAEYNLNKLQNRVKLNVEDKERVVKLTGMTVYDWREDWVFFNQYPRINFEIEGLYKRLKDIGFRGKLTEEKE